MIVVFDLQNAEFHFRKFEFELLNHRIQRDIILKLLLKIDDYKLLTISKLLVSFFDQQEKNFTMSTI